MNIEQRPLSPKSEEPTLISSINNDITSGDFNSARQTVKDSGEGISEPIKTTMQEQIIGALNMTRKLENEEDGVQSIIPKSTIPTWEEITAAITEETVPLVPPPSPESGEDTMIPEESTLEAENKLGSLKEELLKKEIENLRQQWKELKLSGREYNKKLYTYALFDNAWITLNDEATEIKKTLNKSLEGNNFTEAKKILEEEIKIKYNFLYKSDDEIECGITLYFKDRLDELNQKIYKKKEEIENTGESGLSLFSDNNKEELENELKELNKEHKKLCDSFEEFCFDEIINGGVDFNEFKSNITTKGFATNEMIKIAEEVENKLKFMDPEDVKKRFKKELEAMIDIDKLESAKKNGPLSEDKKKELEKKIQQVKSMMRILGLEWFSGFKKMFNSAEEWAKIEEYNKYGKQKFEEKEIKKKDKEVKTDKAKKRGVFKMIGQIGKATGKWGWDASGGMAKAAVVFKTAGAVTALMVPVGWAGVGSTFVLAGGGLTLWKFLEEKARESGMKKGANKINLKKEDSQVIEKLKTNMACLISIEQADKLDSEGNAEKKRIRETIHKFAMNKNKTEKQKKEFLKNIGHEQKEQKGKFKTKLQTILDPFNKNPKSETMEKTKHGAMGLKAIEIAGLRREAEAMDVLYRMIEKNPELKTKFEKKGVLAQIGKGFKIFGIEFAKELAGFGAYELIPLFKLGALGGAFKKGMELPDLIAEATGSRESYEKHNYFKWLAKAGCGAATFVAFAALMSPKTAEGKNFNEKWDITNKVEAAEPSSIVHKTGGNWFTNLAESWTKDFQKDAGIWGSFGKGIGNFLQGGTKRDAKQLEMGVNGIKKSFKEIGRGFKERHGIEKSEGEVREEKEVETEIKNKAEDSFRKKGDWDFNKFTLEEHNEGAMELLGDKIYKLDGDATTLSISDMQNYKGPTRNKLIKEVKTEIAKKLTTPRTVPRPATPITPKETTATESSSVETTKTTPSPVPIETPPSTPEVWEETSTFTVDKDGSVWKIAEKVGKNFCIESSIIEKMTPKEKARAIFKRDAIVKEIAKQMRDVNKNPELVKDGQKIPVDMLKVKEALIKNDILYKADSLTKEQINNIIENNQRNLEKIKNNIKKGREMTAKDVNNIIENDRLNKLNMKKHLGEAMKKASNLEKELLKNCEFTFDENNGWSVKGNDNYVVVISLKDGTPFINPELIKSLEKQIKLKKTNTTQQQGEEVTYKKLGEGNKILNKHNLSNNKSVDGFVGKLRSKKPYTLEAKQDGTNIIHIDDYEFELLSQGALKKVKHDDLEWGANIKEPAKGKRLDPIYADILSEKIKLKKTDAGVTPQELFNHIQAEHTVQSKRKMENIIGKENLNLLDNPQNVKIIEAFDLSVSKPSKNIIDCLNLCNKYDDLKIEGFNIKKRIALAKAIIEPNNRQNGINLIKEWFEVNIDPRDSKFNFSIKGKQIIFNNVPLFKNRTEKIIFDEKGIRSGRGLFGWNKAWTSAKEFKQNLIKLDHIKKRDEINQDF